MKRIKLTHGSARVSKGITDQTIEALNKLSELAYNHEPEPELYKLLGLVFSIDNVMKSIRYTELSEGSGKHGTTPARVLRGENYHIIESPRYMNGIKCWIHQENSNVGKEIECKTVGDLLEALN